MTKQKAIEILNDEYNKNIVYRAVLSDKESDHINDVLIALLTAIDALTADVQHKCICNTNSSHSVKHARWELKQDNYHQNDFHCSNCGTKLLTFDEYNGRVKTPYCPYCGAKMDGDSKR